MQRWRNPRPKERGYYTEANYGYSAEFAEYVGNFFRLHGRGSVVGRALLEAKIIQIPDVLADSDYTHIKGPEIGQLPHGARGACCEKVIRLE